MARSTAVRESQAERSHRAPNSDLLQPANVPLPFSIAWPQVAAHLARHGLAFDLGFTPRRFAGGLANINLLVRVDGNWAVFRRPPPGPLPKGAHDMAREHTVLSRLWQHLPFAPRSLHYCPDDAVAGAPFQIIAYHDGRIVRGDRIAPLPESAETGRSLSEMLVETLAQIHAVDADAVGLGTLGRPGDFLARTAAGWIGRAGAARDGAMSSSALFLADWLERQQFPDTQRPTLLHNDFKLDNVILRNDSLVPSAVVDWDMATRGDPLFDLATMLSYWTETNDPPCMHRLGQMPTAGPGFLTREAAAHRYAEISGRSLDGFVVHRVLAMFKLGTVFHQLHRRYAAEQPAEARFTGFAALADELFDFAADVARGKVF